MKRKAKRKAKRAAKRVADRKTTRKAARGVKTAGAGKAAAKTKPAASHDAVDALAVAGAKALDLPLDPAWKAGVTFNLQLILRHAALVDDFPLPDDAEPAPVYHA